MSLGLRLGEKNEGKWGCKHECYLFDKLLASSNLAFCKAYRRLWDERSSAIFESIDSLIVSLLDSDLCKAVDASMPFDPEWYKKRGTFTEQLQGLRQWFAERKEWMEQHIDEIRVEETGIHDAVSCSASPQVYDLSGRKSDYRKGLRLIKGRKMMVK